MSGLQLNYGCCALISAQGGIPFDYRQFSNWHNMPATFYVAVLCSEVLYITLILKRVMVNRKLNEGAVAVADEFPQFRCHTS